MNNQPPRAAWTTYDELKYLSGIPTRMESAPAQTVLRAYIKNIYKRQRWNFIRKDSALKHAVSILETLEGTNA